MARLKPPSVERVKELLSVDPDKGELRWRKSAPPRGRAGAIAGGVTYYGYRAIPIDGKRYFAHHLIWLIAYNEWPEQLDHINGDKADDRIVNLRVATQQQNCCNTKLRKDNKSGLKGVLWDKQRGLWRAGIRSSGKTIHLGRYKDIREAKASYDLAATRLFGDFARLV